MKKKTATDKCPTCLRGFTDQERLQAIEKFFKYIALPGKNKDLEKLYKKIKETYEKN